MDQEKLEVVVPEGIHAGIIADFKAAVRDWSPRSNWIFLTSPSIATPRLQDHETTSTRRPLPTGAAEDRFEEVQAKLTGEWQRAVHKATRQ